MAPTLQEIAAASECDYDFINNRIRRDALTTKLKPAEPGEARDFTRQNALEIAFLAALVDAGVKPTEAKWIAEEWLSKEAKGKLPPFYVLNCNTGEGLGVSTAADESLQSFHGMLSNECAGGFMGAHEQEQPATRIASIWLAQIVRRIDTLFSRKD